MAKRIVDARQSIIKLWLAERPEVKNTAVDRPLSELQNRQSGSEVKASVKCET